MIDITFDLETCALCPNAAVMSIGAVVWNRYAEDSPFEEWKGRDEPVYKNFSAHVDLRGMFLDGFTFDKQTADWWSRQGPEAKRALLDNDSEDSPCSPIDKVIKDFFDWMFDLEKKSDENNKVAVWCQGSDFDIAILRNICHKYGIKIPVGHGDFRDHRTFFLESARIICEKAGTDFDKNRAYSLVERYEGQGAAHDPIYDCKKSIYSTWQMMKYLRSLKTYKE